MQVTDRNARRRITVILAVVCCVLQLALAPNVGIGNGRINFMLVLAACIALTQGGERGVAAGFLSGLFFDLTSAGPVGLMALLLTAASLAMGMNERNRMTEDPGFAVRAYFIADAAVCLGYALAMLLVGQAGSIMDALFLRAVPTFLLNLLAFAPFVLLLGRWGGSGPALMGGGPRSIGRRGAKHIDTRGL